MQILSKAPNIGTVEIQPTYGAEHNFLNQEHPNTRKGMALFPCVVFVVKTDPDPDPIWMKP